MDLDLIKYPWDRVMPLRPSPQLVPKMPPRHVSRTWLSLVPANQVPVTAERIAGAHNPILRNPRYVITKYLGEISDWLASYGF